MMTTLFSLHLSTHKKGFGKPSIHAAPSAGLAGRLDPQTGALVTINREEARACLPHYYRKAFDRATATWHPRDDRGASYVTLRDSRGRYLNTLYAFPYQYQPLPAARQADIDAAVAKLCGEG